MHVLRESDSDGKGTVKTNSRCDCEVREQGEQANGAVESWLRDSVNAAQVLYTCAHR